METIATLYPYEMTGRGVWYCNLVKDFPADKWVVEMWEQYKCREPSLSLTIVGELQAKLALLNRGNDRLPEQLQKKRLPRGTSVIERDGVRYHITDNSISFEYLDGDTYYGGVRIYRVSDFVPFAKRR